jgi:hypothetical protein
MARSGRRRGRINTGDLAGYGSVSDGTVDIDRAARGLGASKTEVRQAIRQAEAAQANTFYRRMSGRRGRRRRRRQPTRHAASRVRFGGRAAVRSTRRPLHRRWEYRRARCAAGQRDTSDHRPATWPRCGKRRGAPPPPNRAAAQPPRTSAPARRAAKRCAAAARYGSAVSRASADTTRAMRGPAGRHRHHPRGTRGDAAGLRGGW